MCRHSLLLWLLIVTMGGCSAPTIGDPLTELKTSPNSPRKYMAAMETLDAEPLDKAYLDALHRLMYVPGYTVDVRRAAFTRLDTNDHERLMRTIRQYLPRMPPRLWHAELCGIIADRGWVELTPALVSSWATPGPPGVPDEERPEFIALAELHGADAVADVVFDSMLENRKRSQQGYRTRCWTLLYRLGYVERLVELLEVADIPEDDGMLVDLRASALDLGVVPRNREEILWVRTLRKDEHAAFWGEAASALAQIPPGRRATLELRTVPVIVALSLHRPDLLQASRETLLARVTARLDDQRYYLAAAGGEQRLRDWQERLTWSDLATMLVACEAMDVPQVVDHLFDYAERDREDEGTEYGGIIDLDRKGRFQVLEFPPRVRDHDQRFNASQEMFDAGYTALFHFHFHVQRARNETYAGPGLGDLAYAQSTRTNCLVLTSVSADRLNVDYYRHSGVVVDLGVVRKK